MKDKLQKIGRVGLAVIAAICMISASAWFAQSTVTQLSGLAVAENVPTTIWNSVRDAVSGDNLVRGIMVGGNYAYDGTNWDRVRGDDTNGLDVDVTRITGSSTPADGESNPTTLNEVQSFGMVWNGTTWDRLAGTTSGLTVAQATSGGAFYAIDRSNISTTSVNLAFGFTSKKIMIEVPSGNSDDICVDWLGATAVCPSANTAGDYRLSAGTSIILDDYAGTSLSVIAASGTQIVNVTAWN